MGRFPEEKEWREDTNIGKMGIEPEPLKDGGKENRKEKEGIELDRWGIGRGKEEKWKEPNELSGRETHGMEEEDGKEGQGGKKG